MALIESTFLALDSASGSVLSSEALSEYTKHAQKIIVPLSKQPRGQASLRRIWSRSRGFEKDVWSLWSWPCDFPFFFNITEKCTKWSWLIFSLFLFNVLINALPCFEVRSFGHVIRIKRLQFKINYYCVSSVLQNYTIENYNYMYSFEFNGQLSQVVHSLT